MWGVNERYELEPQTPPAKEKVEMYIYIYRASVDGFCSSGSCKNLRVVVYHPSLGKQLLQSYPLRQEVSL